MQQCPEGPGCMCSMTGNSRRFRHGCDPIEVVNIWHMVWDGSGTWYSRGGGGRSLKEPRNLLVTRGLYLGRCPWLGMQVATAHEIGHDMPSACWHDWRDDAYIMSYGPSTPDRLSALRRRVLVRASVLQFGWVPLEDGTRSLWTVELLSPRNLSGRIREGLPIQFSVLLGGSGRGSHQAILFVEGWGGSRTPAGLRSKACRGLSGPVRSDVIEFAVRRRDSHGPWITGSSRLSDLASHPVFVRVVDEPKGIPTWTGWISRLRKHPQIL